VALDLKRIVPDEEMFMAPQSQHCIA